MNPLFDKSGGYRKLNSFHFATLIHLATIRFCKRFIPYREDPLGKTSGQMVGAARSGRQNIIVAGESYGQGSSREHAAMCPMYLGVRLVVAKGFERIHQANLINFGILPCCFADASDYDRIQAGDRIACDDLHKLLEGGGDLVNTTQGYRFAVFVVVLVIVAVGLLLYRSSFGIRVRATMEAPSVRSRCSSCGQAA